MTSLPPQPLSPLDGRYRAAVSELGDFLSEAGLNRARVQVEVEWLLYLTSHRMFGSQPLTDAQASALRALVTDFGQDEIDRIRVEQSERLAAVLRHRGLESRLREEGRREAPIDGRVVDDEDLHDAASSAHIARMPGSAASMAARSSFALAAAWSASNGSARVSRSRASAASKPPRTPHVSAAPFTV